MAAAAVAVEAMPVIGGLVTVERDADGDSELGEDLAEGLIQPDAIGLQLKVEPDDRIKDLRGK